MVAFRVSALETLIGFELQAASLALFNRKMLKSVTCAGRALAAGLGEEEVDILFAVMHRKVIMLSTCHMPHAACHMHAHTTTTTISTTTTNNEQRQRAMRM